MSEPEVHPDLPPQDESKKSPLGGTKSLRAIEAIQRTGFDAETKAVLSAMAMHLSSKRPDWIVWCGLAEISRRASVSRNTVIRVQQYAVDEKVLSEPLVRHKLQRVPKAGGRPSRNFEFHIERLEALAVDFADLTAVRASRGQRRAEERRARDQRRRGRRAKIEERRARMAQHVAALRDLHREWNTARRAGDQKLAARYWLQIQSYLKQARREEREAVA